MSAEPPMTISMRWCPVCGRDDRFRPFTGKSHKTADGRCPGQPVRVVYEHPYIPPAEADS